MFIKRKLCDISAENNQAITGLFKKLLTDTKVKAFVVSLAVMFCNSLYPSIRQIFLYCLLLDKYQQF